ncbi:MAG: DksA/TraR family C4-type zinc finger protein [Pseudomonadota bacterium]
MAGGWTRDGAVQDQIDASVEDALKRLRAEAPGSGPATPGPAECDDCGEDIPQARRKAVPGTRLCVACQSGADKRRTQFTGYNRRGSKDSQLR